MKAFRIAFLIFILGMTITPAEAETTQGLDVDVYVYDQSALPEHAPSNYTLCKTIVDTTWTSVTNINHNFDSEYEGIVAGCQGDFVLVHYYGYITLPVDGQVFFQSYADDGFYLTINDEPVIDNWWLKGCSGGQGVHEFQANVPQKIDAWFYEYGGGACNVLTYGLDGLNFQPIPDASFTHTPPAPPTPEKKILPPANLQATADKTTITLSWDLAVSENVDVERYAVFWTYGDNAGWAIPTEENNAVLADLPEDTDITIWVRADNDTYSVYSQNSQTLVVRTGVIPPVEPPVEPPVPPVPPAPEPNPEPKPIPEPPLTPDTDPKPVDKPVEPEPPVITPVSVDNLDSVNPADLTDEQISQLQEQAFEIFANNEEGSPEYEQALEALFIVAQADDIELDPVIASIPLIGNVAGALTDSINFIGNVGADISPQVRKKAKKVIVSAVIVGQIAIMAVPIPAPPAPPVSKTPEPARINRKNN